MINERDLYNLINTVETSFNEQAKNTLTELLKYIDEIRDDHDNIENAYSDLERKFTNLNNKYNEIKVVNSKLESDVYRIENIKRDLENQSILKFTINKLKNQRGMSL